VLAVIALVIPSVFSVSMGVPPLTVTEAGHSPIEALSLGVAVVMLVLYGLGLFDAARAARMTGGQHSPISVTLPTAMSRIGRSGNRSSFWQSRPPAWCG